MANLEGYLTLCQKEVMFELKKRNIKLEDVSIYISNIDNSKNMLSVFRYRYFSYWIIPVVHPTKRNS